MSEEQGGQFSARRCHFSMVLIRTLRACWALLLVLVTWYVQSGGEELAQRFSSYQLWIIAALLAVVLVQLIYNFLHWRRTWISVDGEELRVNRRTLNRKSTTVRLSTIASVNLKQGILERVFGVCRLQLDINSAATADKTDFDLIFAKKEAEALRLLLTGVGGTGSGDEEAGPASFEPAGELIYSAPMSMVIRHCLLGLSVGSIISAATGGGLWLYSLRMESAGGQGLSWVAIAVVALPALLQFFRPFFLYANFSLTKVGDQLRVSCGLISTHQFSLPLTKTNAIVLQRPALARLFGLCSGEIINIGMGDTESGLAPVFSLLIPEPRMRDILAHIAPSYAHVEKLPSSPRTALPPMLIQWGGWGLIPCLALGFFWRWWAAGLLFAILLIAAYCQFRTKELALWDDKLGLSNGVFSKKTILVEYGRVQTLWQKNGPLTRRLGLARGSIGILASSVYQNHSIGFFYDTAFRRIAQEMLEKQGRTGPVH